MNAKHAAKRRTATKSKLSPKADFKAEAEFQRLRPGTRGGDGLVRQQLIDKYGPGGFGRLLQKMHLLALPNADKIPAEVA